MKRAAYLSFNYSESLQYQRGNEWNPIPKGGKLLSLPKNEWGNIRWTRVEDDRLSTTKKAWEKAVKKYADLMCYESRGYWIKMHADRIQELIEAEEWQDPKVTGLDGFDYHITPLHPKLDEEQKYKLSNPERAGFIITEGELKMLGGLEVYPGALPENQAFHPVYGEASSPTPKVGEAKERSSLLGKATIITIAVALVGVTVRSLFRFCKRE